MGGYNKKKITFRPSNGQEEVLDSIKKKLASTEISDAIRFCIDYTAASLNLDRLEESAMAISIAAEKHFERKKKS